MQLKPITSPPRPPRQKDRVEKENTEVPSGDLIKFISQESKCDE